MKELRQTSDVARQLVLFYDALTTCASEAATQVRVVHQPSDRIRESVLVRRSHQQTIDLSSNQLRNPAHLSRDTGDFHRHGFHQDDRDSLCRTGEHECIGTGIKFADTVLIY